MSTVLCTKFHTILCTKIATANTVIGLVLKFILGYREHFQQNYMLTKRLGCENLQLFFRIAPRTIYGPL